MSQPITPAVKFRMDAEMPVPVDGNELFSDTLFNLFDEINQLPSTTLPTEEDFSQDITTTNALTFGYFGGKLHLGIGGAPSIVADGTIALTNNTTNYVYYDPADTTVKKNTSGFVVNTLPMFTVVTLSGAITVVTRVVPQGMILYGGVIGFQQVQLLDANSKYATIPGNKAFTLGTETSNVRRVTVTFQNPSGSTDATIWGNRVVEIMLADTSGGALTSTAASGGIAVVSGTVQLEQIVSGKHYRYISNPTTGLVAIDITHVGAQNWYVMARCGSKLHWSNVLAFA